MTTRPNRLDTGAIRPGLEIHGYVLKERLGEGGFGEVWRAENLDQESFALKLGRRIGPEALDALRREIELFRRLRRDMADARPPIVTLKHDLLSADPPALVMERVTGGDLGAFMRRRSFYPLSGAGAADILRDILDALAFAHERGVTHRDISPENVLLDKEEGRWKVSDFGLGAVVETEMSFFLSQGRSRQVSGGFAGKLDYMAPERRAGRDAGPSADLYSAGVVWAWLLAGATPSGLPANWAFVVPEEAKPLLSRCLEADPRKRWGSARELREAIDQAFPPGEEPGFPVSPAAPKSNAHPVALALSGSREAGRWNVLGPKGSAKLAAISTGGRALVAGKGGKLVLWSHASPEKPQELEGHSSTARAAAFSPDGTFALTAGGGRSLLGDRSVRLWSLGDPGEAARLKGSGGGGRASCLAFSPDGRRALSGRSGGALQYWDLATRGVIHAMELFEKLGPNDHYRVNEPLRIACSARKKAAFVAGNAEHILGGRGGTKGVIAAHSLEDWRPLRHYFVFDPFTAVALSEDGTRAFGGHKDNAVSFVEMDFDEAEVARVRLHTGSVTCAALSPDGARGLSGSRDKTIRLWDFDERREIACCAGHRSAPIAVEFLGRDRAISCGADGEIIVWNLA